MAAVRFAEHVRAICAAGTLVAAVACPAVAQSQSGIVSLPFAPREPESVAADVAQSVVQVVATAYGTTPGSGLLNVQRLVGAGAIVDPRGYILTSAHLVADAMQVDVVIAGDTVSNVAAGRPARMMPADVVGIVADLDLAVLRVEATGLPALRLSCDRVREGDRTLTVAPGGAEGPVTAIGVVLASGVPVREDSPVPYLVTAAAESVAGAPVVNAAGELVGLAAAFVGAAGSSETATVALPAAILEAALAQVTSPDPWRRGVIGLAAQSVRPPGFDASTEALRSQLVVSSVAPGLPAERAGLRTGDLIVSIDGQPVDGMELSTLYLALYTLREGQALHLGVERAGHVLELAPTAVSVRHVLASR